MDYRLKAGTRVIINDELNNDHVSITFSGAASNYVANRIGSEGKKGVIKKTQTLANTIGYIISLSDKFSSEAKASSRFTSLAIYQHNEFSILPVHEPNSGGEDKTATDLITEGPRAA